MASYEQTFGKKRGAARPHTGERYCLGCGRVFKAHGLDGTVGDFCARCKQVRADACTVYDRDRRIGAIPRNLRE